MKLVIAEKPSVAQSIAKVIGAWKRHEGFRMPWDTRIFRRPWAFMLM